MPEQHLQILSLDDFRSATRKGEKPVCQLRKAYAAEVKAEGDAAQRLVSIRITTATRDRDRDTVDPKGWLLANYRKNPVVLWCHDYWNPPVAQDKGITQDELGLIGTAEFATKDQFPFADTIYQLILGGFLRAASVGFRPEKWQYNENENGIDFLEQELLEYSIVPVPANPEALVGAKAAGISLAPLRDWAEKALDLTSEGEPHMLVSRKSVERAMKLLEHERTVLWVPAGFSKAAAETYAKDHGATLILAETAPTKDADEAPAGSSTPPTPAAPAASAPAGDPTGAPAGTDPAAPAVPEAGSGVAEIEDDADDDAVLALEDEDEPEILSFDDADLKDAIGASVTSALSTKLTHLTGRLD